MKKGKKEKGKQNLLCRCVTLPTTKYIPPRSRVRQIAPFKIVNFCFQVLQIILYKRQRRIIYKREEEKKKEEKKKEREKTVNMRASVYMAEGSMAWRGHMRTSSVCELVLWQCVEYAFSISARENEKRRI